MKNETSVFNILINSVKDNNFKIFKKTLIESNYNLSDNNNSIFSECCILDRVKFIKFILNNFPNYNINYYEGLGFIFACEHNSINVAKELLKNKQTNPATQNNYAIGVASEKANVELFKLLIKDKRVDPSDDELWSLIAAANEYCYIEERGELEEKKDIADKYLYIINQLISYTSIIEKIDEKWILHNIYSDKISHILNNIKISKKIKEF